MTTVFAAAALAVVALVAAWLIQRRKPDAPTNGASYHVPNQIDRADFLRPDIDQIVVVFSSATCHVCAEIVDTAMTFASRLVAVHNVEFTIDKALHERYEIDAVPTVLVANQSGVVTSAFTGLVQERSLRLALGLEPDLNGSGSLPAE